MKRIVFILMICLFVTIAPLCIAQEEEAIDDDTLEEAELIAESTKGAQVRVMQLTRAVARAHVAGEKIVEEISGNGGDVTQLQGILNQIKGVKDELEAVDYESDDVAGLYVSIKTQMKEMTKEFRAESSPQLTAENRQAVQNALQNNAELTQLQEQVRSQIRNVNAERVQNMLSAMGASDSGLMSKVQSGTATKAEVKTKLMEHYQGLSEQAKQQARERIGEMLQQRTRLRTNLQEMQSQGQLSPESRGSLKGLSAEKLSSLNEDRGISDPQKKGGAQ